MCVCVCFSRTYAFLGPHSDLDTLRGSTGMLFLGVGTPKTGVVQSCVSFDAEGAKSSSSPWLSLLTNSWALSGESQPDQTKGRLAAWAHGPYREGKISLHFFFFFHSCNLSTFSGGLDSLAHDIVQLAKTGAAAPDATMTSAIDSIRSIAPRLSG